MKYDIRLPENYIEYDGDEIMSNFDGVIVRETEEYIKDKELFSRFAGWNFNGLVWHQFDKWNCEVWVNRYLANVFSEDTLEELRVEVCDSYGYD